MPGLFELYLLIIRFAAELDFLSIIENARRTIRLQAGAVAGLETYLGEDFARAVEVISASRGRLIVSGIGKSAIVAQKIVATLNSTGTPSIFMHAADAIHGDLGIVQPDDVVMILSKSGSSPEIKFLVPLVKQMGNQLIALVGDTGSFLAQNAHFIINSSVDQEACPNNLAPTSSTTAQMVMGDAMAVCLMEIRGFKPDDFARYHPGGALGKKLFMRVEDLSGIHSRPAVAAGTPVKEVIIEITRHRLGTVAVLDDQGAITGIITDGDIRRMMEKHASIESLKAEDIMGRAPRTINHDSMAAEALGMMRNNNVNQLLVTDNGKYAGVIHLQDLLREGIL